MNDHTERPDLHGFPLTLLLADRKVVVVGAGTIATRKVETLIAGGARNNTVIAPTISDDLSAMCTAGFVTLIEREFVESDIDNAYFVVTATDVAEVNEAVFQAGEARHTFVNSADDPNNCSSILMSTVRQGDITIAISTAGKSPAFAKWCRKYLEGRLGPEYITLIDLVNEARESVRSQGVSSEDVNWDPAFEFTVVDMVRDGNLEGVRAVLRKTIEDSLASQPLVAADAADK